MTCTRFTEPPDIQPRIDADKTRIYPRQSAAIFLFVNEQGGFGPLVHPAGDEAQASSFAIAFMLSRTRPCLSTSSTLTLTMSPSESLSLTFSTRSSQIWEM